MYQSAGLAGLNQHIKTILFYIYKKLNKYTDNTGPIITAVSAEYIRNLRGTELIIIYI